ncbi:MAG: hypothetical protein Q4D57_06930 [Clostridia bacterium]|nr:hypothetical protein [Clostridia bacterium]MDO4972225.1 hypothetical protein [Bacteroidales bacterium]
MKKRVLFIVSALLIFLTMAMNWETVKDWACMFGLHKREVKGVWVSDMAIYLSREQDVNYCEMLSESLDGNIDSFRKFIQIKYFDGEYFYDHGYRVCKVISSYSQNDVAKCFSLFTQDELKDILWLLEVGLEYYSLSRDEVKKINNVIKQIEVKLNKKDAEN